MPIVTIRYSLPAENMDHRAALAGVDALLALEKIDQTCRSALKHGEPNHAEARLLQQIRDLIPSELLDILE